MSSDFKLIVSDIDGTICPASKDPSSFTIDTIEAIRDKGYLFGLASGRPVDDVMNKYSSWNMKRQFDFLIGWNGAQLYDNETEKQYSFNYLKKEWIKEIIEFMDEFDPAIHMYLPEIYLSSKDSERGWYSAYKNKRTFTLAKSKEEFYRQDNGGIMFRCDMDKMDAIHEKLETIKDKPYVGFNTQPDLIEFSHKDSNKGYALEKYCELHNIDINKCISFGDTTNDNKMLEKTYGVCMLNGSADTKACAKIITDKTCEEDGFALFLERNLL